MTKYNSRRSAKSAAWKALGRQAVEWVDFTVTAVSLTDDPDDRWNVGYVWEPLVKVEVRA
jgi:hypothetical protein